nr:MAG TPA: hypothetical protein [Bacteriophage sp.]
MTTVWLSSCLYLITSVRLCQEVFSNLLKPLALPNGI